MRAKFQRLLGRMSADRDGLVTSMTFRGIPPNLARSITILPASSVRSLPYTRPSRQHNDRRIRQQVQRSSVVPVPRAASSVPVSATAANACCTLTASLASAPPPRTPPQRAHVPKGIARQFRMRRDQRSRSVNLCAARYTATCSPDCSATAHPRHSPQPPFHVGDEQPDLFRMRHPACAPGSRRGCAAMRARSSVALIRRQLALPQRGADRGRGSAVRLAHARVTPLRRGVTSEERVASWRAKITPAGPVCPPKVAKQTARACVPATPSVAAPTRVASRYSAGRRAKNSTAPGPAAPSPAHQRRSNHASRQPHQLLVTETPPTHALALAAERRCARQQSGLIDTDQRGRQHAAHRPWIHPAIRVPAPPRHTPGRVLHASTPRTRSMS